MQCVRAGVCVAALLPGPRALRRGKPYYGARCLLLRRRSSASGSPRLVRGGAHLVRAGVVVVRAVLLTPGLSRVFLGLRVHVVGAGVHVQLAERVTARMKCDSRGRTLCCATTQNDGSAQPRRGGDHLAVPTGVNRQLLADPVGWLRLGPPVVPAGPPWPPLSAPAYGRCGRRTGCCTALARGRRASTTTTRPRTSPHTAPATSQVRTSWQRGARLRSIRV